MNWFRRFIAGPRVRDPSDEPVPQTGPHNCPRCASRIELVTEGFIWACQHVGDGRRCMSVSTDDRCPRKPDEHPVDRFEVVEPVWVCAGLADRDEVERYLAPEFPGGRAPASVTSKKPCGWSGKASDYGRLWR